MSQSTLWTKAEDVPKADADKILVRWDKTAPDVQRIIVLQKFLDCEAIKNELDAAENRIAEYDDLIADGTEHPDQDAIDALRGIVEKLKNDRKVAKEAIDTLADIIRWATLRETERDALAKISNDLMEITQ